MKARLRAMTLTVSAAVAALTLLGYALTGFHPYTRLRDREIEEVNRETDLSDLFIQSGATQASPPESIESADVIGLLPSGFGLASLSVATVVVPALGIMGVAWWFGRRPLGGCAIGACRPSPRTQTCTECGIVESNSSLLQDSD